MPTAYLVSEMIHPETHEVVSNPAEMRVLQAQSKTPVLWRWWCMMPPGCPSQVRLSVGKIMRSKRAAKCTLGEI